MVARAWFDTVPHHSMSMGQLWGALAPQGYNLYPTAGYVLAQLDNLFICGEHVAIHC